jgi:hypothetical protein
MSLSPMDCYRCHKKDVECYRFMHKVYCQECFNHMCVKAYELITEERLK